MAAYFRLFVGLPGVILEERDEIGWFVSENGQPGTEVLWTRFDQATCDKQIDNALAEIGAHSQRFDWVVYRTCQPANVGKRLEAKGLKPSSVTWLLASLTDIPDPTPLPNSTNSGTEYERRIIRLLESA